MSSKSNNNGRAFELLCLNALYGEIAKIRSVSIIKNSAYTADERALAAISDCLKSDLERSAIAATAAVLDMEPMITEATEDELTLCIQTDEEGQKGDVRDIVISRKEVRWEIGLSVKHNHFAVKHSRLAKELDFGKRWFDIPCSLSYWNAVKPVFSYLEQEKQKKTKWRDLKQKDTSVYVPLLKAFRDEVLLQCSKDFQIPKKMVEYLLGEFDFYKIISIDSKKIACVQTYNMHGKLNKASSERTAKIKVPVAQLPTRIVAFEFKPASTNTLELYMDGGWQFSFRIHNASTIVETSLKFDIQIVGMPAAIISIECKWN